MTQKSLSKLFSVGIKHKILTMLSTGDISLNSLCKQPNMPNREQVRIWRLKDKKFDAAYTAARETGYDMLVDQGFEILEQASSMHRYSKETVDTTVKRLTERLSHAAIDTRIAVDVISFVQEQLESQVMTPAQRSAGIKYAELRLKYIQWCVTKILPKKYGEAREVGKVNMNIPDNATVPPIAPVMSPEERELRIDQLLEERRRVDQTKETLGKPN